MLRVVLDSNVYISALLFGGNPRTVFECAENGLFQIAVSPPIKTEVARILATKFAWPPPKVEAATSYLWSLAHTVSPGQTGYDCSDPDDNRILECAMDAQATVLVTGDGHLLKLHPYREILILTPAQFLETRPWRAN